MIEAWSILTSEGAVQFKKRTSLGKDQATATSGRRFMQEMKFLKLDSLVGKSDWMSRPLLSITTTWLLLIIGTIVLLSLRNWAKDKKLKLPPGPLNFPVVGAIFSLEIKFHLCFSKFARKYGPIVHFRMGSYDVVVVSSARVAEEVMKHQDTVFSGRPTTIQRSAAKYLGFNSSDIGLQGNTPNMRYLKKICSTELFTGAKLAKSEAIRKSVITGTLRKLRTRAAAGELVDMRQVTLSTTTMLLSSLLFGKRFRDGTLSVTAELTDFRHITDDFVALVLSFNLVDLFPKLEPLDPQGIIKRYKELASRMKVVLQQVIKEHRDVRSSTENYEDEDFVDVLLTHYEQNKLTEDNVMGALMDMMVAGIETSAASTEWALIELSRRPHLMKKFQLEIDSIVGKNRPVAESDFPNLPYLQAIVSETYRLHPPLPCLAPRFNLVPATLGEYDIPANTAVFVNVHYIGRDPNEWQDPLVFRPERFLEKPVSVHGVDYRLTPFGSGRRQCAGKNLGLVVFQLMITSLVHAYDWNPPPGKSPQDISDEEGVSIVVRPSKHLHLIPAPRLADHIYSVSS